MTTMPPNLGVQRTRVKRCRALPASCPRAADAVVGPLQLAPAPTGSQVRNPDAPTVTRRCTSP
jgi:hypothetical protein